MSSSLTSENRGHHEACAHDLCSYVCSYLELSWCLRKSPAEACAPCMWHICVFDISHATGRSPMLWWPRSRIDVIIAVLLMRLDRYAAVALWQVDLDTEWAPELAFSNCIAEQKNAGRSLVRVWEACWGAGSMPCRASSVTGHHCLYPRST